MPRQQKMHPILPGIVEMKSLWWGVGVGDGGGNPNRLLSPFQGFIFWWGGSSARKRDDYWTGVSFTKNSWQMGRLQDFISRRG
jgi:hypothetical protein